MSNFILCASVGVIGATLYAKARRPLLKLQRAVVYTRAAGYLALEMIDGARSRMNRWRECVDRSRREA